MTTLHIQHDVQDFAAWKHAFDQNPLRRDRCGVTRYVMYRAVAEPRMVFVQMTFEKREDAEAYLLGLERMLPSVDDAAGFGSVPQAWLLDEIETHTY